jgi:uncharacterized protein YidB (DUF937 family)
MGLLDSVVGALAGGAGGAGGGQGGLLHAVVGMLANNAGGGGGGVAELVERFQQGGLGDVIGSWIGTGQNLPVSPDQLRNVLGSDALAGIAQRLGLDQAQVAGQLSQMLPEVLDKLTPHGSVPQGGLGDVSELLGRLLQR